MSWFCPQSALNMNRTYFGLQSCPPSWAADNTSVAFFVLWTGFNGLHFKFLWPQLIFLFAIFRVMMGASSQHWLEQIYYMQNIIWVWSTLPMYNVTFNCRKCNLCVLGSPLEVNDKILTGISPIQTPKAAWSKTHFRISKKTRAFSKDKINSRMLTSLLVYWRS